MAEKVKTAYFTAQKEEVDVSKIVPINRQTWRDKLRAYTKKPFSMAAMLLVLLAALITALVVFWIIIYTLVQGIPHINAKMFSWTWTKENQSILSALCPSSSPFPSACLPPSFWRSTQNPPTYS